MLMKIGKAAVVQSMWVSPSCLKRWFAPDHFRRLASLSHVLTLNVYEMSPNSRTWSHFGMFSRGLSGDLARNATLGDSILYIMLTTIAQHLHSKKHSRLLHVGEIRRAWKIAFGFRIMIIVEGFHSRRLRYHSSCP